MTTNSSTTAPAPQQSTRLLVKSSKSTISKQRFNTLSQKWRNDSYQSPRDQVLYKKALSSYILRDHIQSIERAIAANLGLLPDSDLWKQLFSDLELLHEDETQLWWAGKELFRDKRLSDFVGSNEKTKIVIRLRSPAEDAIAL
eukprot:TRINITY_DN19759_c0_g1_i15.p1 TRINITY_DN19759_c0_g1~~TRINITY_DN19759_c0_g1_i15.p1  ORF type:complete len:143 (-),score=21.04 TRINITY_DN19759_c0_g1_i15:478-906(-)